MGEGTSKTGGQHGASTLPTEALDSYSIREAAGLRRRGHAQCPQTRQEGRTALLSLSLVLALSFPPSRQGFSV